MCTKNQSQDFKIDVNFSSIPLTPKNILGFLSAVERASGCIDPSMWGWCHFSNFNPNVQLMTHNKSDFNFIFAWYLFLLRIEHDQ